MVKYVKKIIQTQSFHPTPILGLLLNPFYFSRSALKRSVERVASEFTGKTLDVGCGSKPYLSMFSVREYIGMEIDVSAPRKDIKADLFYDGWKFPFPDQSFDHVVTFQVLEHVEDPNLFVSEIGRILKPGGSLLLTVPFVWEEHEVPFDRTRYTSYGLKELLERGGFAVTTQEKLNPGLPAIAQLLTGTITVGVSHRNRFLRYLIQFLLVAPIHFLAKALGQFIPVNDRFFLDNLVLARKRN